MAAALALYVAALADEASLQPRLMSLQDHSRSNNSSGDTGLPRNASPPASVMLDRLLRLGLRILKWMALLVLAIAFIRLMPG